MLERSAALLDSEDVEQDGRSFWTGKQAVSCGRLLELADAVEYKAALSLYAALHYAGQEERILAVLQGFDCFFADVSLASSLSQLSVLTEGSNIAEHIRRYRCAVAQHSGCHQAHYASVSAVTQQFTLFLHTARFASD